jgi:hypothetical protein
LEQQSLRKLAAEALERHGFEVKEAVKCTGGARLKVEKAGAETLALVRTSSDRWVGWMRDPSGALKGLDDADIVVVAALDPRDDSVEVLAFEPADVRAAFEANIAARGEGLGRQSPVFICLDETRKEGAASVSSNFKTKAIWREDVAVGDGEVIDDEEEDSDAMMADKPGALDCEDDDDPHGKMDLGNYIEKVKAELAVRLNVPKSAIVLELRLQL